MQSNILEPVHAHNVTTPQSPSKDSPLLLAGHTEVMGTLSAHVQEKLPLSLRLYPDAPITLPKLELLFDGWVKQKHPKLSKQ